MLKKCYFVRHGEAEHNIGFNSIGEKAYFSKKYMYSMLTKKGIEQAKLLNNRLIDDRILETIDIVLTSPLDRAIQTAQYVIKNAPKKIPIFVSDNPREFNYQHPCNMRRNMSSLIKKYPDVHLEMMENQTENDELFVNGDMCDRTDGLMELLNNLNFQNIIIVSHESFLRKLFREKFNEPNVNFSNCDIISRIL